MNYTQRNANCCRAKISSNGGNSGTSTALLAVALQDHWIKNITLNESQPAKKKLPSLESRLRSKRPPAKAVVDTGLKTPPVKQPVKKDDKEYVLDPKPAPLTLAQKLGLVDAPSSQLSEGDWAVVKAKSNARHDSTFPCVICKEDFGTQQQVLLSCTHVFHRACLEAFERFSGKKCCPMCRKEQYQKRVIHEGAKEYKHICATRIQAAWRAYVVRSWYNKLRKTVPPKDPVLKKKFYHDKLTSITDRMVRSLDFDVNGFLQELDENLKQSREIFKHFDSFLRPISQEQWRSIQLKATERAETDCPICLTELEEQGWITNGKSVVQSNQCQKTVKSKTESEIKGIKLASRRKPNSASAKRDAEDKPVATKRQSQRAKVLLSCSHVFHNTCLEAFEEFAVGERRHVCPVCRNHYQKRVITGETGTP